MMRDVLIVVMALGALGMLVIFAYAVHKYGEAQRHQREASEAAQATKGEAPPSAELSAGLRIYAVIRILPAPLAVLVFAFGLGTDSQAMLVAGAVLIGLWPIDMALIMPVVLARANRTERRRAQGA